MFHYWKAHRQCYRWEGDAKKVDTRTTGNMVNYHFISKMGKGLDADRRITYRWQYLVCTPWKWQARGSGRPAACEGTGQRAAWCTRMASTCYGRTDRRNIQFNGWYASCSGDKTTSNTSSDACISETVFIHAQRKNTIYSLILRKTQLQDMQAHKSRKSASQKKIPKVERFEFLMRKFFRYCYCELQNSQWIEWNLVIARIFCGCRSRGIRAETKPHMKLWIVSRHHCWCNQDHTKTGGEKEHTSHERLFATSFEGPILLFGAVIFYHCISSKVKGWIHRLR